MIARSAVHDLFSGTAMTTFFSTLMLVSGLASRRRWSGSAAPAPAMPMALTIAGFAVLALLAYVVLPVRPETPARLT